MKKLLMWMLMVLISSYTFSQSGKEVTGKVTDESGSPVPGVSVVEQGTTNGTITNNQGNYNLVLSKDETTLQFSFIGFENVNMSVGDRNKIDVVLEESVEALDEVVVVGYGEVRKRDLTGAVVSVRESEEVASQYSSVDKLLQGRAAGLQVVNNPGDPGGAVSVRIRGTNSLRGNNEPLYVVDGVIISTAGTGVSDPSTDANELQSAQNGLTGLNPRDIESVEVLKDASATAIYGSRGANGVVLITTKSGGDLEKGKASIKAYGSLEWSQINKKLDLLDPVMYADYQNEANGLQGFDPKYHIENGLIYPITNEGDESIIGDTPIEQVKWQDEIYEMSLSHEEGLSVNGRTDNSKYYFSAGFSDTQGIVETTKIQRGDLRFNFDSDLTDRLKFDSRVSMMYQNGSFAQGGSRSGGKRSFVKQVLSYRPLNGDNLDDDELDLEVSNPYSWLTDYDDQTEELRVNARVSFVYELLKGLKYKVNGGLDYRKKDRTKFYDREIFKGRKEDGLANYSYLDRYSYVVDNLLMYRNKFNRHHSVNAVAGVTYDGVIKDNKVYEVASFPLKTLRADYPQAGQLIYRPFSILAEEEAIFSFLGRVNYSFRDKYVLTASFRGDQSTKFREGNQWGYFPSMAVAWRMMQEPFIDNLNIFHNLKLRLGWGQTGNQAISPYQTRGTYTTTYYVDASNSSVIANAPARIPNPDLTWETSEQYNAGLDMAFFKGRLSANIDAYFKSTKDLLQEIELGPSNGFTSMYINRGTIENKGVELSLSGYVLEKKDVSLDLGGHVSFNNSTIKDLGLSPSTVWIDGKEQEKVFYFGNKVSTGTYFKQPANVFMEDEPLGVFWGWETDGIYQDETTALEGPTFNGNPNQAGDVIMVDQNGDGNVDESDKTIIGDPNPDFTYGFDLNFRYKNLTLSALFDGVYGNEIVNGYSMELDYAEGQSTNIRKDAYVNAWRPDATSATYPRIGYDENEYLTDRIVEDGSYLRLNNVTVGYDLPSDWLKAFSNVHIYASGNNLFTLTDYSGYNPQITSFLYDGTIMGVDWVGSPSVRTFLLGMNITF
ncbi:SusC/RagA family TonB-linked outer membrane protein [Marinilabilia rubra]|nr:TonB-dependent receptor [Marinilabilia rubra]